MLVVLCCYYFAACSVSKNPLRRETRLLRKGILKDDSSYVYALPYEIGHSHWLVQGYFSRSSHKERAALDFKMKKGTKICAARDGVVIRLKEDGNKGGWNRKYRPYGNFLIIQHSDGSRAGYWHLQKNGALVAVGDSVKQGQVIGLSGKTGYAAFPHLHFLVWTVSRSGQWQQIPTRFQTKRGPRYLRTMKAYRKPAN
jgi:murein DD-endopeptidase MepM/ murein hydrolase activator NlpD